MKQLIVYTDGSSLGNPGEGGWGGILLVGGKKVMEMGGYQSGVTNNQMELEAILRVFKKLVEKSISGYEVEIKSDSKYCIEGITKWILGWKKNGWKNAAKHPVKNREYWEEIDRLKSFVEADNILNFTHVKAHSGEVLNERVDDIARGMAESEGELPELFVGDWVLYKQRVL